MSDLVDRYVAATLRSIPEKQRGEIEDELRASIADETEARTAHGAELEEAEVEVLSALGAPDRLAASYTGSPGYLIGPELFYDYKRLVLALLFTVVPIVTTVLTILRVVGGDGILGALGGVVGTALTLALHVVFWTTLVFALIERSGEKPPLGDWTPDRLPAAKTPSTIALSDTVASVVALGFVIAMFALSGSASPLTAADGSAVPFFDPDLASFWIPYFVTVLGAEIIFEIVKYRVGHWNWTLATVNLALNAVFAVPAIYLLSATEVVNQGFFDALGFGTAPGPGDVATNVAIAAIAGIAIWDVFDGFRKAART